jgi:hypothetical protein
MYGPSFDPFENESSGNLGILRRSKGEKGRKLLREIFLSGFCLRAVTEGRKEEFDGLIEVCVALSVERD